jgi:hypothetical protein
MALIFQDQNGNIQSLQPAAVAVGVSVSEVSRDFEIAGALVTRQNAVGIGTAAGLTAHEDGLVSFWKQQRLQSVNRARSEGTVSTLETDAEHEEWKRWCWRQQKPGCAQSPGASRRRR